MNRIVAALLALALLAGTWSSSYALDRRVKIINKTDLAIVELYASNVGEDEWTFDMLRGGVIEPHSSRVADMNDGSGYCKFDLKAVMKGGEEIKRFGVDVCTVVSWTIN